MKKGVELKKEKKKRRGTSLFINGKAL